MHFRHANFVPVLLGSLLLGATAVRAQLTSISGLYTTGVNSSNALLGSNAADSHYVVTASSAGSAYVGNSYTVTTPDSGWAANTSSARWIVAPLSGTNGTNDSRPSGTYDYTLTFNMPAGAQLWTVAITGAGFADDSTAIYVNGVLVSGEATGNWTASGNFTLNSSNSTFKSGSNTITFQVTNTGGTTSNASGLLITSLSGKVNVPETGAFLPVAGALGLYGLRAFRRRRRGKGSPSRQSVLKS